MNHLEKVIHDHDLKVRVYEYLKAVCALHDPGEHKLIENRLYKYESPRYTSEQEWHERKMRRSVETYRLLFDLHAEIYHPDTVKEQSNALDQLVDLMIAERYF